MPTLLIKTNVSTLGGDAEDAIMRECSASVSEHTGKPEKWIMVSFENSKMIFGGSAEPCAFVVSIIASPTDKYCSGLHAYIVLTMWCLIWLQLDSQYLASLGAIGPSVNSGIVKAICDVLVSVEQ